jgi:hypothetical protein
MFLGSSKESLLRQPQGLGLPASFLPRGGLCRRSHPYYVPGLRASDQPHEATVCEDEGAFANSLARAVQAILAIDYGFHCRSSWLQRQAGHSWFFWANQQQDGLRSQKNQDAPDRRPPAFQSDYCASFRW